MTEDRKKLYKVADSAYLETKTDLILKEGNDGFNATAHHRKALRSAVDAVMVENLTPTAAISEALLSHQLREDTAWKAEYNYKCSCNAFSANSAETHVEHVAVVIQRLGV